MKKFIFLFFLIFYVVVFVPFAFADQNLITYVKVDEAYLVANDFKTIIGILGKGDKIKLLEVNSNKFKVEVVFSKKGKVKKGEKGWLLASEIEITQQIKKNILKGKEIGEWEFVTIGKIGKPFIPKNPFPSAPKQNSSGKVLKFKKLRDVYNDGLPKILGEIENVGDRFYKMIKLELTLYDKNNEIVGHHLNFVNNLAPGGTRTFDFLLSESEYEKTDHYKVEVTDTLK